MAGQRIVMRHSEAFKRTVVAGLESGRFRSIAQARERYGIRGAHPETPGGGTPSSTLAAGGSGLFPESRRKGVEISRA